MKEHAEENEIWDRNQMGTCQDVLGTVDQLLIDNCIMEEVRIHKRNLAVAYYDYRKAYDMVHHDWMLRVYEWMGIPKSVCKVIEQLMVRWKTRLEVFDQGKKVVSRWIEIKRGFLQGDSYSPVGFCLTEIPIAMLLEGTEGYRMGPPGNREVIRTHSLFIDDLKVYQENHARLEVANETIVLASLDTGACYGVKKCAEIVFKRGKMIKGEGLSVIEEKMKALNPDQREIYKFLGCEQAEKIDMERVMARVKAETQKRMNALVQQDLYDKNLIKAINRTVIPVAGYVMNVCTFTKQKLDELDKAIKKILRDNKMHGRQASDERLYMRRENGGRGLKNMKDLYEETKVRVACYMTHSESAWIKTAWRREFQKEGKSIKSEAEDALREVGENVEFCLDHVKIQGIAQVGDWRKIWKKLKTKIKERREELRIENYKSKNMQSEHYKGFDMESHKWLKCNIDARKVSAIINMQEQMIETRGWKASRGLNVTTENCRLCDAHKETVMHILSGCKVLAGSDYLKRHNNALMVLIVEWAKQESLLPSNSVWYKQKWSKGTVLEKNGKKICWDFEFTMRKTTSARRPDVMIENDEEKKLWIVDMAYPNEKNIGEKHREKLSKYQQLAFEMREKRPEYRVEIVPIVIGCLGGVMKQVECQVKKIIKDEGGARWTCNEMLKTVLFESESMLRKTLTGIIQKD